MKELYQEPELKLIGFVPESALAGSQLDVDEIYGGSGLGASAGWQEEDLPLEIP